MASEREAEEWRRYDERYEVSSLGNIRRITGEPMSQRLNLAGRKTVRLHGVSKSVASVVAQAFLGPRPVGLTIDHVDGNKTNDAASNLEYVTIAENIRRSHKLGIAARGERIGNARLTTALVSALRTRAAAGERPFLLSQETGIPEETLCQAINGTTWKHVSTPTIKLQSNGFKKCRRGHDLSPENSYVHPDGSRECRLCKAQRRNKGRPLPAPPQPKTTEGGNG